MGRITSGKSSRYKRNIGVNGTELTGFFAGSKALTNHGKFGSTQKRRTGKINGVS